MIDILIAFGLGAFFGFGITVFALAIIAGIHDD